MAVDQTTVSYFVGHAVDDDIQQVFLTMDAAPFSADSAGRLSFRIYTPGVNTVPETTIAEMSLGSQGWRADQRLVFPRVLGVPTFGAPVYLEAKALHVNTSVDPIWKNVGQLMVTIVFSKPVATHMGDSSDTYGFAPFAFGAGGNDG